jgi:hypothetical protein
MISHELAVTTEYGSVDLMPVTGVYLAVSPSFLLFSSVAFFSPPETSCNIS